MLPIVVPDFAREKHRREHDGLPIGRREHQLPLASLPGSKDMPSRDEGSTFNLDNSKPAAPSEAFRRKTTS